MQEHASGDCMYVYLGLATGACFMIPEGWVRTTSLLDIFGLVVPGVVVA
jgi:hypothetical protein